MFFRRTPSFLWSRWKRTSCDSVAVYRPTGMLTIPKEIVPRQMARGTLAVPSAALAGLRAVFCAIPDIKGITRVFGSTPPARGWLHSDGAAGRLAVGPPGG